VTAAATGAIYDIGYRTYEGARLGRGYAFRTLLVHSLRSAYGLGRPGRAKVIPFLLLAMSSFPALIQVLIAGVSQGKGTLLSYENYFQAVQAIMALFCAAQAPELVSTEQQHRVLPLYFSRPLRRADYASAKLAAMFLALMVMILIPMAILLLGRLAVATDVGAGIRVELPLIPRILGTGIIIAAVLSTLSVSLASLTPRRAIGSALVIGAVMLTAPMSQILRELSSGALKRHSLLLNPMMTIHGVIDWIFQVPPPARLPPGAPLPLTGPVFLTAALAWAAAGMILLYTRYARVPA